eukprot:1037454-Amphidinium_carterae.1
MVGNGDEAVDKGHKLPVGHLLRKHKGRYVFQGNNLKDQDGNWAIFRELGASPASMEASKFVDFIGMLPGNTIMQSVPRWSMCRQPSRDATHV